MALLDQGLLVPFARDWQDLELWKCIRSCITWWGRGWPKRTQIGSSPRPKKAKNHRPRGPQSLVNMADPFLPSGAPAHPFQQPIADLFQPGPSPQLSATAWRWHNQRVECQPAQWNEQQWNKWQTDSSSRVVWQCLVLPLVTRARAYRNQAWCSELVYDFPISWSPLLPSPVRLLCSHLQLPFNLFANENSIAKQRCHSKEKQKTQLLEHNVQPQSLAILLLFALLSAQGAARQVRLPPMGPLRCVLSTRLPAFPASAPAQLPWVPAWFARYASTNVRPWVKRKEKRSEKEKTEQLKARVIQFFSAVLIVIRRPLILSNNCFVSFVSSIFQ